MSKGIDLEGYQPNIAIIPGETLKDYLQTRNWTQVELAGRIGLTPKTVNEIIKGKAPITPETALKLEAVFKETTAKFWINLQTNYDETKARLEVKNAY